MVDASRKENMVASEAPQPLEPPPVVASIADVLKESVSRLSSEEASRLVEQEFTRLRLLDAAGRWSCDAARQVADSIRARDVDGSALAARVDDAFRCALQNPILVQFLRAVPRCSATELRRKVREEGATVLPRVLAYSLVLEGLGQAMYDDWHVLAECGRVWKRARRAESIWRTMTPFDHAKLASVQYAIGRTLVSHASERVPADFARNLLPLNIVEACLEDLRLGYSDNAACGWVLARHRPGQHRVDPATGAGPSRWSDDRKGVAFSMDLPKQWADLYSSWNLAFVSHYGQFPFIMVKLLIPFVADYQQRPELYVYRRALALWAHLHHLYLGRADEARTGMGEFVWNDEQITRLWGRVNRDAAVSYAASVRRARATSVVQ